MKRFCHLLAASAIALPGAVLAQNVAGPYVSIGGGVDLLRTEIISQNDGSGPGKQAVIVSPGAVGEGAFGYRLGKLFRLEIAGDYNHGGASVASRHDAGGQTQFGGFVNILYDFSLGLPVSPYLGLGAGYQVVGLDPGTVGPAGPTRTPEEGGFAYQGIAGLSYQLSAVPGLSITAEYRMMGVLTPPPVQPGTENVLESGMPRVNSALVSNVFNHEALFGLRYAFGAPAAPPAAPAAVATPPVSPPSRTYLVFFDWDRAELSTRGRQIVAEAAAASTRVQTTRIEVNGYTDLSGSAAYNQRLSARRAESVAAELVRDGVSQSDITTLGRGETNPLVPTAQGVREPQNRRVEIIVD